MSVSQNKEFIEGVNEFLKAANFDEDVAERLRGLVLDETDGAISRVRQTQASPMAKQASHILESEGASALEKFLVKQAQKEGPDAKIIQEDGKFKVVKVKDNGENGEVLGSYDERSDAQARLDKYYSKAAPAMEDEGSSEKSAQATGQGQGQGNPPEGVGGASVCRCPQCGTTVPHQRGTPCNENNCPECGAPMTGTSGGSKEAQMTDPGSRGYAGRKELAKRFLDGGEFDNSACMNAMEDEDFVDDPAAYCRSLASLVGRSHEATRGEDEGEQS